MIEGNHSPTFISIRVILIVSSKIAIIVCIIKYSQNMGGEEMGDNKDIKFFLLSFVLAVGVMILSAVIAKVL